MAINLEKFKKPYSAKETEDKIYQLWEKSGFFNPDKLPKPYTLNPKSFTIIMPPVNANGNLHAGHALVMAIEDIITRYKRMRGFKTLWLPGLDHAGFETQVVYEKNLEKQGRSRFSSVGGSASGEKMAPEELYQEIWDFTQENKKNIESQIRKMGASCDWSREKFTLDKDIVEIVYETFEKLRKDGLVYRGKKIINWCPKHQTSLSELETENTEKLDKLYYLKYGPFTIATARPETKFGDKYVVMHPQDKRYSQYKTGQKIKLEWINGPIETTVVKDKTIDMDFGTGVMTITPWHDPIDFEIAERHNLDKQQIIDFQGRLLPIAGEFESKKITEARPLIVEKLKSKGLLEKIDENYKHTVKTCYKCGQLIEPQIKEQWFLKMEPLAEPAIKAIEKNQIKFIPPHYKKIILHWLKNIMDWPLSRQIVWGIPIPGDLPAGRAGTDTFDTWFSSGQWPFATLLASGRSKSKIKNQKSKLSWTTDDFENFYPTDVMETAGEIIFFWIARMIMLGIYATGKIPFKTVYLHGLVLDGKGQKMSKSRGNVIDPLQITGKYGTDALRIGLVVGNTPGQSLSLDENRIKGYKHFANKIWNATRFVLENTKDLTPGVKIVLNKKQKNTLNNLKKKTKEITKLMDDFKFYYAAEKVYHYFWHIFCDKIIEESKPALLGGAETRGNSPQVVEQSSLRGKRGNTQKKNERRATQYMLLEILTTSLKLLHPFMPFITEEIYQSLPVKGKKKCLMIEKWPSD